MAEGERGQEGMAEGERGRGWQKGRGGGRRGEGVAAEPDREW